MGKAAAPTTAPTAAPAPPITAGPIEFAPAAPLPPRSSTVFMGGAAPSAPEPRAAGRQVFVGNIGYPSSSEIKAFFAVVGEVTNIKTPMDATGARTPFCFVTFASIRTKTKHSLRASQVVRHRGEGEVWIDYLRLTYQETE